ncbi:non-ribosomal peptide synthetase [Nonomuraea insulae]|uniref:Amino acid adenylation domain-containing protein n=1 Tax=Nonomuraea insulae TaxID=1616787 RepID=A0ABW1D9F6_9ACTN
MKTPLIEEVLPLTPLQEGLWFHANYDPSKADVYVGQWVLGLSGPLDLEALRRSIHELVRRHGNLRAAFVQRRGGELAQVVVRDVEVPWRLVDLSGDPASAETHLPRLRTEERERPFSMTAAPLLRFALIKLTPKIHRLVLTVHHILIDGWSAPLLMQELFDLYQDDRRGRVRPFDGPRYRDYLGWLSRQNHAATERAWLDELRGVDGPTLIAPGFDADDGGRESLDLTLPADTTARLVGFARTSGLTLNTVIQGAWGVMLASRTNHDDVLFGATVSGRPAEIPNVDRMIGLLVNTIPVRVRCHPQQTWGETLQALWATQSRLVSHHHVRLSRIQHQMDMGPLFDTMYSFQSHPDSFGDAAAVIDELVVEVLSADDGTHYPLAFQAAPGPQLRMRLAYTPQAMDRSVVDSMGDQMAALLTELPRSAERSVGTTRLLSESDLDRLRQEWAHADAELPAVSLTRLVEAQAAGAPAHLAIATDTETLTYQELNERANRLARLLTARGARPERIVALALERSADMVVAMLAVIKTGACYLPLNADELGPRVARMLADAKPMCVVTHEALAGGLADLGAPLLVLDSSSTAEAWAIQSDTNLSDDELATPVLPHTSVYVTYTSGSTGRPKAIVNTHENLVALVLDRGWRNGSQTRVLGHSPPAFDATAYETWVPLAHGGTIILTPPGRFDPADARRLIRQHGVTGMYLTAKLLTAMVEDDPSCLTGLQEVWSGAEAAPVATFRRALREVQGLALVNVYGPTETTVFATRRTVEDPSSFGTTVPIGTAMDNTRVYLLDTGLRPVPADVVGEIYIAGAGVARGYHGQPGQTAERFVADPLGPPGSRMYRTGDLGWRRADGELEFAGRADDQVKIRGHRVEPAEVEAAFLRLAEIARVAVVIREDRPGDKRLVAYVVPHDREDADPVTLRRRAARSLPHYLVPAAVVLVQDLPLTTNGKLDRDALPAPDYGAARRGGSPGTDDERAVCALFTKILGIDAVGVDDDFFDLGGDSLSAIRLANGIRRDLGAEVGIHQIFETPRVADLAMCLGTAPAAKPPLRPRQKQVTSLESP